MQACVTYRRRLLFGVLFLIGLPAVVPAAEPASGRVPEWQFKPGQALRWTFDQSVNLQVPQGNEDVEVKMKQILDFDVDVTSVEKGMATLAVSTARIRVVTDLPDGKTSYDSAAGNAAKKKGAQTKDSIDKKKADASTDDDEDDDESVENLSRDLIARTLAPVRDLKYSVTLDKHCLVRTVTVDEKTLNAFKLSRPLQAFLILLDKDGFSSAYAGGFVRMPADDLPADQTWRSKVTSSGSGLIGKGIFEHVIRRDGTATVDGRELQKFAATVEMTIDGNELTPFKLGKQTGTGVIYFDEQQGRVRSSEWTLSAQLLLDGGKVEGKMKIDTNSQISDREKPE